MDLLDLELNDFIFLLGIKGIDLYEMEIFVNKIIYLFVIIINEILKRNFNFNSIFVNYFNFIILSFKYNTPSFSI